MIGVVETILNPNGKIMFGGLFSVISTQAVKSSVCAALIPRLIICTGKAGLAG